MTEPQNEAEIREQTPPNEPQTTLPEPLQGTAAVWHPYLQALLERVRAVTDKS
jgi:hypothetical protein